MSGDIREDPAVKKWLDCYLPEDRGRLLNRFENFYRWLQGVERFRGLSPSQLVEFQRNSGKDDEYLILDALQTYVRSKEGRHNSLITV